MTMQCCCWWWRWCYQAGGEGLAGSQSCRQAVCSLLLTNPIAVHSSACWVQCSMHSTVQDMHCGTALYNCALPICVRCSLLCTGVLFTVHCLLFAVSSIYFVACSVIGEICSCAVLSPFPMQWLHSGWVHLEAAITVWGDLCFLPTRASSTNAKVAFLYLCISYFSFLSNNSHCLAQQLPTNG